MMNRPIPDSILSFWQQFETTIGEDVSDRFLEVFHFCDNEEDADELATLVLRGTKRATASLRWRYEAEGEPLPT